MNLKVPTVCPSHRFIMFPQFSKLAFQIELDLSHCCSLKTFEVAMKSRSRSELPSSWQFSSFLNTLATLEPTTSSLCHVKCTITDDRSYAIPLCAAPDLSDMNWKELDEMLGRFNGLENVVVGNGMWMWACVMLLDLPNWITSIEDSMPLMHKTGRLSFTDMKK